MRHDDYGYEKTGPSERGKKGGRDAGGGAYYQRSGQENRSEVASTASYQQSSKNSYKDEGKGNRHKKYSDDFSDELMETEFKPKSSRDTREVKGGHKNPRDRLGRQRGGSEFEAKDNYKSKNTRDNRDEDKGAYSRGGKEEFKSKTENRDTKRDQKSKPQRGKNDYPESEKFDFSKKQEMGKGKSRNNDYKDENQYENDEYDQAEDYQPIYEKEMPTHTSNESCIALMIAEKPSIALSIAKALGGGNFTQRKGRSPICPVYQYRGKLMGHTNVLFKVTSVAGHVYSRDFPKQYSDWQRTDPMSLFDAETVLVEANPKNRIVDHVKHEANNASFVVLWLDNDREGENICFEILNAITPVLKKESFKQIYRAVFSSLAPTDLQQCFKGLSKGPNRNESISVDARQIIDLKIGVVFSRFQSLYFGEKYSKLSGNKITYGPCQTPTLGFCVQRQIEIETFKPEKYYGITANVKIGNREYQIPYTAEKRMAKGEAERVQKELLESRDGIVKSIETSEKKKGRPEGLNTVEVLKHASIHLGMGPHDTMRVAERLYLSGYITYPRTESTSYPTNFDFKSVVDKIKEGYSDQPALKAFASRLTINKPKKGVDVGDHPPITPTTKIAPESMGYPDSK